MVSEMLEPCAMKVARTVLRGVGSREATYLPDVGDTNQGKGADCYSRPVLT